MAGKFDYLFEQPQTQPGLLTEEEEPQEAAPLPDPVSKFDYLFQQQPEQRSQIGVEKAKTLTPDQAIKNDGLAKNSGLPADVVERKAPEVEKKLQGAALRKALRESPGIRKNAERTEAHLAAIADDVMALMTVETAVNSVRAFATDMVGMTVGTGLSGLGELYNAAGRSLYRGLESVVDPVFGEGSLDSVNPQIPWFLNPGEIIRRPGAVVKEIAKELGPEASERNIIVDVAGGGGQLVGQITLALIAPQTLVPLLIGTGADIQADQTREAGAYGTAEGDAAIQAGSLVTAALEKSGLDNLLDRIPGVDASRITRMLMGASSEGVTEVAEGVVHNLIALGLYDPDSDILNWDTAYEGGVAAIVGGIASAIIPGKQRLDMADGFDKSLQTAKSAVDETKTSVRSPEKLREVLSDLGADQQVSMPAQAIDDLFQAGVLTDEDLETLKISEQLDAALHDDGDVEVNVADLLTLKADDFSVISQHVRMAPEAPTSFEAQQDLEQRDQDVADLLQSFTEQREADPEAKPIKDAVTKSLKATGVYNDAEIEQVAELAEATYRTRAQDMEGVTADQLFLEENVRIRSSKDKTRRPAIASFEQTAKEFAVDAETLRAELDAVGGDITQTPRFKEWFGESKVRVRGGIRPTVVYRGIGRDIDEQLPQSRGPMTWVTTSSENALEYEPDNFVEMYAAIQNPADLDADPVRDLLEENDIDPDDLFGLTDDENAVRILKDAGYDGIMVRRPDAGDDVVHYAVFDDTQVKSVFNRGSFDPNDPRILFQDDDLVGQDIDAGESIEAQQKSVIARVEDAGGEVLEFDEVDELIGHNRIPIITLQDMVGMKIFPTVADRTAAGVLYTGVQGTELDMAIPLLGGPFFPLRVSNWENDVVWANRGESVTSAKESKLEQGATHMLVVLGDRDMHISNTTVSYAYLQTLLARIADPSNDLTVAAADKNIRPFLTQWQKDKPLVEPTKPAKMTPKAKEAYEKAMKNYRENKLIRKQVNGFPGFSDFGKLNDYMHSISFESRKKIMQIMGGKKVEAVTGVNMEAILNVTREAQLSGQNWGDGVLVVELQKEDAFVKLGEEGTTPHPDFPLGIRGKVVGKLETPVRWDTLYSEWLAKDKAEKEAEGKTQDNPRRAFELARPVLEITQAKVDSMGDISSRGIMSPLHATMVADMISQNWARSGVAKTAKGGIGPADFINAANASDKNPYADPLRKTDSGKDGLNAAINSGDIVLGQLGNTRAFYGMERDGDKMVIKSVINNDVSTEGLAEIGLILDAVEQGATHAVAKPGTVTYNLLRDFGFDPEEGTDLLVWTGDQNARAGITGRYLRGGVGNVLGRGVGDAQRRAAIRGRQARGMAVARRGGVHARTGASNQAGLGGQSLASGAYDVADQLAQLSDAALENLGLTQQDRANIQELTGRPVTLPYGGDISDQVQAASFPTDDVVAGLLGAFPDYLVEVSENISKQRRKLIDGKLTMRDIAKAYAITVASQGAGAIKVDTFTKKTGFTPTETFIERGMIRPEEAVAMWFGTKAGQRALNTIDPPLKKGQKATDKKPGKFKPDQWQELLDWRKAFGDDRLGRALNAENGAAMLQDVLENVNRIGKRNADPDAIMNEVSRLHTIAVAKSPFMAHLLGMGSVPTMDAVEINFWTTGQADVAKLDEKSKQLTKDIAKSAKGKAALRDRVAARFNSLRLDARIKVPRDMDRSLFQHIMHHWLWDRAKGIETTHKGVYEAMDLYQTQQDVDGPRGLYRQEQDTYGDIENVIVLTENANRTTFLHELGHFWLFQMQKDINDPRMTPQGRQRRMKMMETTKGWFYENRADAWRDFQKMTKAAVEAAKKDPKNDSKAKRAERFGRALAHAKANGGEKYMGKIAQQFMTGTMDYGTELETAFHEMWARGTEAYLGEGKAPSAALRNAFQDFSTWIIGVYKKLRNLNVNLTPEVRDVFDRLVATEEEIQAEQNRDAYQVPAEVEEYATDAEKKRLRELNREAAAEARAEMQGRVARQLKKERTEEYRAAKESITERVTAEVRQRPLYRALNFIKKGIDHTGEILLEDDDGNAVPLKIDRQEVLNRYGAETARRLKGLLSSKGETGMTTVDELATYAGFPNAADMIDALTAPYVAEAEMIQREVNAELERKFGKLLDPEQLADDAAEVVANEKQLALIGLQSKILKRAAKDVLEKPAERKALEEGAPAAEVDRAAVEDAERGEGADTAEDAIPGALRAARAAAQRRQNAKQRKAQSAAKKRVAALTRSVNPDTVKAAAKQYVQQIRVREATPARYRAAADRLAKKIEKAIAARDYDEAGRLMQQKMMNIAIAKEAMVVQRKVNRQVQRFQRLLNRSDKSLTNGYDMNMINALRVIMEPYGLAAFKPTNYDPVKALAYMAEADEAGYNDMVGIIRTLTAEASQYMNADPANPYKEMPVDKFNQLISAASAMLTNARAGQSTLIDGRRVSHDDITAEVEASSAPLIKNGKQMFRGTEKQRFRDRALGTIRGYLVRVESFARMMDGGSYGPMQKYLVQPVMRAATEYNTKRQEPIRRLMEALKAHRGRLAASGPIKGPGGYVFQNKGELLHAILHTGNESNKRKLLIGGAVDINDATRKYKFADVDEDGNLDTTRWDQWMEKLFDDGILTKEDMDLVQEIWDIFEDTKGAAQQAHNKMYGYYFDEIEATPVSTPFGTYAGGYVPAITDSMMNEDAGSMLDAEALATQQNASMFPGAEDGFTKGRVEYNKPMNLDLMTLPAHYDRVAKFTYLGPAVRDAARLVLNKKFKAAVHRVDKYAIDKAIIPWLQRTVNQQTAQTTSGREVDRFFMGLSRNVGMQAMAGNIVNAAQQLTGVVSSWVLVKPKYTAKALKEYKNFPDGAKEYVASRSPYMQNRMYDSVNDMMMQIEDILRDTTPLKKTQHFAAKYAYFAQQYTQNLVDPVVWLAAEQQARAEGLYDLVYNDNLSKGEDVANELAEMALAEYADSVVRQTQSPMRPEDQARIEAGIPFVRLFTKFYSYFNNMYNLNRTEWKILASQVGWKGKPGRAFYLYVMGIAAPAIMAEAISMGIKGAFDDEDEEMPVTLLELFGLSQVKFVAGFVPGASAVVNYAVGQFTSQYYDDRLSLSGPLNFLESTMLGAFRLGNTAYDAITGENDVDTARALKDALQLIGVSLGLPTNWFSKPVTYLMKVEQGKARPQHIIDYAQGFLTGRDGTED